MFSDVANGTASGSIQEADSEPERDQWRHPSGVSGSKHCFEHVNSVGPLRKKRMSSRKSEDPENADLAGNGNADKVKTQQSGNADAFHGRAAGAR